MSHHVHQSWCQIGYEVERTTSWGTKRSVVFLNRARAKAFKADNPGAKLRVVEVCDAKVRRVGKRTFGRRRRRR